MNVESPSNKAQPHPSEAVLGLTDFRRLAEIVRATTGIQLPEHKRTLAQSRLRRRLTECQFETFEAYLDFLESGRAGPEMTAFCNALTTNLTSFFREPHHFNHLKNELSTQDPTQDLRIWSAGCSSGEETYSIAMTVCASLQPAATANVKILATDLDTDMLRTAMSGVYAKDKAKNVSHSYLEAYFEEYSAKELAIAPMCRDLIRFNRLNLIQDWPMKRQFDYIFCRNVMIYFEKAVQETLIRRLVDQLKPGGILYIGHSETALGRTAKLSCEGHTIYRKVE